MTALINTANLFFVLGYFTSDLLRLRLLSLAGTACLVAYFALQPEPVRTLVAWNLLFLGLNLVQLAKMLRPRWPRVAAGRLGLATP